MSEFLDDIETELIEKYKLTGYSTNTEILDAAQKEYPPQIAGAVAAGVRHILKGKK